MAALAGFPDNAAHLRAELEWVHQLIASEIRAASSGEAGAGVDEFAGLCISREEVEHYLGREPARSNGGGVADLARRQLGDDVTRARAALDLRAARSLASGVDLRLERLVRAFDLDGQARTALLCAAAAELDAQVSRMFAYLQNDATKKRPTFGLLARLIMRRLADPVGLWQLFPPTSPLFADRLLDSFSEVAHTPLPARESRPAAGVVEFLLGIDSLPAPLAHAVELVPSTEPIDDLAYHVHHRAIVQDLVRYRHTIAPLPFCYIAGPAGAGHRLIAAALSATLGKGLLVARWVALRSIAGGVEEAARLLSREARLRNCLVLLDGVDENVGDPDGERAKPNQVETLLCGLAGADVIATGTIAPAELRHRLGLRAIGFELPYPTVDERREIWRRHLPPGTDVDVAADVPQLAQKFRFTPAQIAHVVQVAEMAAPHATVARPFLEGVDLHARCREEAQRGLHLFCQKIVPRFGWDDIVLPADTHAQLQEICRWVKDRSRVYETWGFGTKLAVGRGVTVLFSGSSGTGKTMSAEIIASDLQLDLFRVDLSRIVSKYIGETEKNLSRIFEQSAIGNCVLFFDEADALFGKRTEVKDAHDRYANIEVNYLLSEMDRSEGIIIVSTNLKGNLDPAFIRRFSHVVEYPVPNEQLRQTIWCKAFPADTPRNADVDFDFLAQRFNLAGGHIKNIVLTSAFLAAADAREIGMEHVIRATKREYQKIGRICSKSDFGPYYGLVRDAEVS
ncbi:MAG: AAA family ATPase [Acidobacteriota bacterium]